MSARKKVVVVGGGPTGICAALTASRLGAETVTVPEEIEVLTNR